jgi:hypothetical protein
MILYNTNYSIFLRIIIIQFNTYKLMYIQISIHFFLENPIQKKIQKLALIIESADELD